MKRQITEFDKARRKDAWSLLGIVAFVAVVAAIVLAMPGLLNILLVWLKNGRPLSPITGNDVSILGIEANYSISIWWNILGSILWLTIIFLSLFIEWEKARIGWIRWVLSLVTSVGGLLLTCLLGDIFYGFVFSLFVLKFAAIILFIIFLYRFMYRKIMRYISKTSIGTA